MGRGELVVHPMETLYCLEPTDPIDDPGEQAERQVDARQLTADRPELESVAW